MSWDVYSDSETKKGDFVQSQSQFSWKDLPGYTVDKYNRTSAGLWQPKPIPLPAAPSLPAPIVHQAQPMDDAIQTSGLWDGIKGFFGGLFSPSDDGGGFMGMNDMLMMMMMFGGFGGGRGMNSNMLLMMMLMQSGMFGGGLMGGAAANPLVAMMLPRMGMTKAMLLGGAPLAMQQMLFKPRPRARRRIIYRYPRRRYYRNYSYRRY